MCHPYEYFDGPTFAAFVREKFPEMFRKAGKKGRRIFVQDNDPVQNSGSVRRALNALKAKQLKIPPSSPDVNKMYFIPWREAMAASTEAKHNA